MKEELMAILPDLKNAIQQGVTYAGDLFNRAVEYYKLLVIIKISSGILFIFVLIVSLIFSKKIDWNTDHISAGQVLVITGILFGICVPILCLSTGIQDYIQLTYIPEVYIYEMLKQ